jgi:hypothetical protein
MQQLNYRQVYATIKYWDATIELPAGECMEINRKPDRLLRSSIFLGLIYFQGKFYLVPD